MKNQRAKLPLLIVSGASGAGKTTVYQALLGTMKEVVMLEGDLIWRAEFNKPETHYRDFFETWLKICQDISRSGRPVVMFNAGMGVPENIEPCVGRKYFSEVHYLALVCDDGELSNRLYQRPESRKCSDPEYIKGQIEFNHWLINEGPRIKPQIELINTTEKTIEETTKQVTSWIRNNITDTRNEQSVMRINISTLTKELGPKFSARFVAFHTALDKLNALIDFLLLNYQEVHNDKSARWQRNFNITLMLSFGILFEVYYRIKEMTQGPMKALKKDVDLHNYILSILDLFKKGKEDDVCIALLEAYRNQMSFHIDVCNVRKGLEINRTKVVDFLIFDSVREIDTYHKFPEETLFNGFFIRNESMFAKLIDFDCPPASLTDDMQKSVLEKLAAYLNRVHKDIGPAIENLLVFLEKKYKLDAQIADNKPENP